MAELTIPPHYITVKGGDDQGCWSYALLFPNIAPVEGVAAHSAALLAVYREFGTEQGAFVGAGTFQHRSGGLTVELHFNSLTEQANNFPIYRRLRQLLRPTLHFTAQTGVSIGDDQTCRVAFRILASQDDEGVENLLLPDAEKLGFRARSNWPDFVVDVHGGVDGYDRLTAMFNSHSVYLPRLTSEQKLRLG